MTLLLLSPSPFLMEQVEAETSTRMPFLKVIGKCYTLREGIRAVRALRPEVVLLDGDMQGATSPDALSELNNIDSVKLIVLIRAETTRLWWKGSPVAILQKPFEIAAFARLLESPE
jgi:DNA-binding NarL/FixJ family response regulator